MRVSGTENAAQVAQQVKAELAQSNDIQAISKKYTGNGVTVQSADMGLRNLTDIPAELAARITPLDVGQTSELIEVRDGIHVVKVT